MVLMSTHKLDGDALGAYIEHHRYRVLQEALQTATAAHWTRRAEEFEAARPGHYVYPADYCRHGLRPHGTRGDECPAVHRKGELKIDWPGRATADELAARDARMAATALACRQRAQVSLIGSAA
jgi:hypothetical protein